MTRLGMAGLLVTAAGVASCAHERPRPIPPPPPQLPEPVTARRKSSAPPEWFWEPVEPEMRGGARPRPSPLPVEEASVLRIEGGARIWDELGAAGRERLRRDGIVVLGDSPADPPHWHMGVFYNWLRDRRVPYVVTVDALFSLAHLALTRALAEIEHREIAPLLDALLAKLDARLGAEHRGAGVELRGGYRLARGIVAVARALAAPRYAPPEDLAPVIEAEKALVEAHAGAATSPLLGVPIDYARFAVPAASGHPRSSRAMAWLTAAPLVLVGRSEARGAPVSVGEARHHARGAMLLARLADRDVDPEIHGALSRIGRLAAFVWGPADDLTPLALGDLAEGAEVQLGNAEAIANVVTVDKLRSLARASRSPSLWDGSGGVGIGGVSVRLLGAHASIDTVALSSFAGAAHVLPTTLDLAAWLGAPEVRAALRESGADQREGYDATLARVVRTRPTLDAPQLHASVHGSFLDALLVWAASRSESRAADRARLESVLAAWTLVRDAGEPFARPVPPPGGRALEEVRVSGGPLPAFVEEEPEAIARLLATVRQIRRGLGTIGPLSKGSSADAWLAEVEDVVRIALRAAEREVGDEPIAPDDAAALAAFPARIAALETAAAYDAGPYVAVIHSDPSSSQALVSASGPIEPAVVLARDGGRIVLAVGAHLTHFERIERSTPGPARDHERGSLEQALRMRGGAGARAAWTGAFRMAR